MSETANLNSNENILLSTVMSSKIGFNLIRLDSTTI
ncbi:hypothetical protein VIMY103929_03080 [Vibrio mytili]